MKKTNENLKCEMSVERIISQQFEEDDQSLSIMNGNFSATSTGETISFSPLSYGQQALWFLYQIAHESVAYNIFDTALIRSYIDISALQRAWQKVVNRHPILRTTYTTSEGKPFQIIQEQLEGYIQVTDALNGSEDYLKKQILLETDRPFNLEKELPWRLNIFTLSPQEHVLLTMKKLTAILSLCISILVSFSTNAFA